MSKFVNIISLFNESNRTNEYLSSIYLDKARLTAAIRLAVTDWLKRERIHGKRIFLKPNWVNHSRRDSDEVCLRANDNFVVAFIEILCELNPRAIVIGDAPIQGCKWDKMISREFVERLETISKSTKIPIEIKDLRREVFIATENRSDSNLRSIDQFVIFDVGSKSYLEPITRPGRSNFRVTHYNPDRFILSHKPGMHKYCITKELFDADLVISIPKVKTHEKSGITGALKNIVGLNGDKDFLPHHRIGGTGQGGDSYPKRNIIRYISELCYDQANRSKGKRSYLLWVRLAAFLWRITLPNTMTRFGAGWHGNDTTWRMVMDLNLIAVYGQADGTLSETPVREVFSLCDGIIGGQGDGPLKPDPLNLGVIAFTNHSGYCDVSLALLMGMNINKLPLLNAVRSLESESRILITLDGRGVDLQELTKYSCSARMPSGWSNYNE